MEKIYRAKDGKICQSEKECIAYEKALDEKEQSRKKMHEEVEKAKSEYVAKNRELQEAYKKYNDALKAFCNKYGTYHENISVDEVGTNIIDFFFNIL